MMKSFGLIACAVMAIASWFAFFSESRTVSAVHPLVSVDAFNADDVRAIFGEMLSTVESQSSDKFSAIDKRIGDLEAMINSSPKVSAFDSSDLASRIDSLEAAPKVSAFDSSSLDGRVSEIEALVEKARKSTRSSAIDAKLVSLEASLADVKLSACKCNTAKASIPVSGGSSGSSVANPYAARVSSPVMASGGSSGLSVANSYAHSQDPSECTVIQPSHSSISIQRTTQKSDHSQPTQRAITLQRTYQPATQCVNGQCNQVSPSRQLRFR